MSITVNESSASPVAIVGMRATLVLAALAAAFAVAATAGARYGALLMIGIGFGLVLEGFRFGFAGPWRAMIQRREPAGLVAQLIAIALVAAGAIPLLATHSGELVGAHAPIGYAMLGGAFTFGLCMQIVMGCGSGTLVNAGSGNLVSAIALPFFAVGSFAGAYSLDWWTELGTLPVITMSGMFGPTGGLLVTLAALGVVAGVALWCAPPEARRIPRRLWVGAVALAALGLLNFVVAGQPWGIVYGLGLWAAKGATLAGADLSGSVFWSLPDHVERLQQSLLTDVTSLTNLGIIGGAFLVTAWRGGLGAPAPRLPARAWAATVVAGLLLGYSSRIAFGCNVGAFFSGVSTGSLHGWAWFAAAFAGAMVGVRMRPWLGLETRA